MSRISAPADRPIPTNEPKLATQQTSETESIQKTDIAGKAPFDAEQVAKEQAPATETKGQQFESRLGGLARQTELQSQFPIPSTPVLKDLPDANPNLDPNVHLDEKIDVTKNLPGGHAINSGLAGLEWGIGKAKTGPNHMGVDLSTGGMKAPTDRIAEVLNSKKPDQPKTFAPQKPDGGNTTVNSGSRSEGKGTAPPPGAELSFRAPKWDQLSQDAKPAEKTLKDLAKDAKDVVVKVVDEIVDEALGIAKDFVRGPELVKEVTGDSADLLRGVDGGATGGNQIKGAKKLLEDDKTMVDPDAGGDDVSAEDISRIAKVHFGSVEHGINPDLGVDGGPSGERKDPIDLLRDPIDDGETPLFLFPFEGGS